MFHLWWFEGFFHLLPSHHFISVTPDEISICHWNKELLPCIDGVLLWFTPYSTEPVLKVGHLTSIASDLSVTFPHEACWYFTPIEKQLTWLDWNTRMLLWWIVSDMVYIYLTQFTLFEVKLTRKSHDRHLNILLNEWMCDSSPWPLLSLWLQFPHSFNSYFTAYCFKLVL